MTALHPAIQRGIDEVVATFGDDLVEVTPATDGATWLTVSGRHVGDQWNPPVTDITVKVLGTYPTTPIYPIYLPAGFAKSAGDNPSNLSAVQIDGRSFMQLSLNAPNPEGTTRETIETRIVGAISWLRGQA